MKFIVKSNNTKRKFTLEPCYVPLTNNLFRKILNNEISIPIKRDNEYIEIGRAHV